ALEGAPSEVLTNLTLAQLRVARVPVLGLRVLGEVRSTHTRCFDFEVLSAAPSGEELVARGRIELAPGADEEQQRITRFDALEPFEAGGGTVTAATFDQARAAPPAPPKDEPQGHR